MKIKHPAYDNNYTLRWYGTLVGDQKHHQVLVAAPSEHACLKAAQAIYPDSVIDLIQPVSINHRSDLKAIANPA